MSKNEAIDLNKKFYIFDNFITTNKHILERGDEEWDSSKIFFQLSIEHADNSPLTHGAERFEDNGKVDWDYLKNQNRAKNLYISPVIRKESFYTGGAMGKKNSDIGGCISYNEDQLLIYAVNEPNQNILQVIETETLAIVEEFTLNNEDSIIKVEVIGNYIVVLDSSGCLVVLDTTNHQLQNLYNIKEFYIIDNNENIAVTNDEYNLAVFVLEDLEIIEEYEGHEDDIKGLISSNDTFITWTSQNIEEDEFDEDEEEFEYDEEDENEEEIDFSQEYDISIRVWDRDSEDVNVLEGHKAFIRNVQRLDDDSIVSFDEDDMLIAWSTKTSKKIYKLDKFDAVQDIYVYKNILIVLQQYGRISIRDKSTGKKIKNIDIDDMFLKIDNEPLVFISDERILVGSKNGKTYIIDLNTYEVVNELSYSFGAVESMQELGNKDILVRDNHENVVIYKEKTNKPISIADFQFIDGLFETKHGMINYSQHEGVVLWDTKIDNFLAFDKDKMKSSFISAKRVEDLLYTLSVDGEVLLYDLNKKTIVLNKKIYTDLPKLKVLNENEVVIYGGNRIDIWRDGEILQSSEIYEDEEDCINNVLISNGSFIVIPESYNEDNNVYVLDSMLEVTGSLELDEDNGGVSAAYVRDTSLFLGYEYGELELWNFSKEKLKKNTQLKNEASIDDIKVFDLMVFAIDEEGYVNIFDENLKKIKKLDLGKISHDGGDNDIELYQINDSFIISASFGTYVYNNDLKLIHNLENLLFKKYINSQLLFSTFDSDEYKILDSAFQTEEVFTLGDKFSKDPEFLHSLGLCLKLGSEYVYHNNDDKVLLSSSNKQWHYEGFLSLEPFVSNEKILTEFNGNVKFIK